MKHTNAPEPHDPTFERNTRLLIPALIALATFLAFAPSLSCGFVDFDDARLITENPAFRGLSPDHLRWMLSTTIMGHWQPLTWLTYAIDYSIAGMDPAQYHLTNLLLHSANAVLFYFVIRRLVAWASLPMPNSPHFPSAPSLTLNLASAAGALLWSLHPLRVESVTWVTERRDVLSGFFLLLTILAYVRAFPPNSIRPASWAWYAASIALLALSLLAKAWGMSFFIIATVLDWYPLRRLPPNPLHWPRAWPILAQKLPFLALGLGSVAMAGYAQRSIGAARTLADWPLVPRIVQSFYGLVFYIWKTVWPTRLCALYEIRHDLDPFGPSYLFCYALVLGGAAAVLLLCRRLPGLAAAALAYAASVAPVLGLFQSGDQFVADRYSYISCMSWSVLASGALLLSARRPRAIRLLPPIAAILLVLAGLTWVQTQTWTSAETLWRHAWTSDPTRMVPHLNYGFALEGHARELEKNGRAPDAQPLYDEALDHYRTATRLKPTDGRGWYPLGNALRRKHDFAGAETAFRTSARYIPQAYLPLVNLGYLLERDLNRPDEALEAFRAAVDSVEHPRPGSAPTAKPYLALGAALKKRNDFPAARAAFSRALELGRLYNDAESQEQAAAQLKALGP